MAAYYPFCHNLSLALDEDTKLNMATEYNLHNTVRKTSQDHDVPFSFIYVYTYKVLKQEKWHLVKIYFLKELSDNDSGMNNVI